MGNKLLLMTARLLSDTDPMIMKPLLHNTVLFTEKLSDSYEHFVCSQFGAAALEVHFFENYFATNLLEKKAIESCEKYNIQKIVVLSEVDLLRAARIRQHLGIHGQSVNSATIFRNKYLMKIVAKQHGIPVSTFARVNNVFDILSFIDRYQYPIILKPLFGRGSGDVYKIRDERDLNNWLQIGFLTEIRFVPAILAEKYIEGTVHHIDGMVYNDQITYINVSRYVNSCLGFVQGDFLGSITLSDLNPLRKILVNFAHEVLQQVFSIPKRFSVSY